MKKKTVLIVAAVALGALLTVGGTLAWFTDTETATNVVTMGNVDITLKEDAPAPGKNDSWTAEANPENNGVDYGNILPGTVVGKNPTVTNTGKNPAYVRVKAEVSSSTGGLNLTGIKFMKGDTEVELDEGYFYYEGIMKPGAEAYVPFDHVKFPGEWDNSYANQKITIKVTAEAVQAENLGAANAQEAFDKKRITPLETAEETAAEPAA